MTCVIARPSISAATVKSYVTRLLAKLDARDRAQLVIAAYENALVTPVLRPRPGVDR
jgi:DNA-binding NarL/FixJ family response regulator